MSLELLSFCDTTYLNVTTLHKKVEKSIGQVGGKGTDHPRVEEGYVGDLGRERIINKGNLAKNAAYPEHCKDEAAEKESKVGGRVDWWQKVQLVHLKKNKNYILHLTFHIARYSPVLSSCSCPGAI